MSGGAWPWNTMGCRRTYKQCPRVSEPHPTMFTRAQIARWLPSDHRDLRRSSVSPHGRPFVLLDPRACRALTYNRRGPLARPSARSRGAINVARACSVAGPQPHRAVAAAGIRTVGLPRARHEALIASLALTAVTPLTALRVHVAPPARATQPIRGPWPSKGGDAQRTQ